MTDDELRAITQAHDSDQCTAHMPIAVNVCLCHDEYVPALVAEVRRLRAALQTCAMLDYGRRDYVADVLSNLAHTD